MERGKTLVVNLFAGPGTGKSATAASIFAGLKWKGVNCEMAPEYAKEQVWAENLNILEDQLYIFGKQQHRLFRLKDKVDVIIADSPILLSLIYGERMKEGFKATVMEQHNLYNNYNILLKRTRPYEAEGRLQNLEGAQKLDNQITEMLETAGETYEVVNAGPDSIDSIVDNILEWQKLNQ